MKKTILMSLALFSFLLTACDQDKQEPKQNQPASQSVSSSSSDSQKRQQDNHHVYQSILDDYKANGHYGQYAYYDIDQNGSDELLLGQNLNGQAYLGLIVYSQDGQAQLLPDSDNEEIFQEGGRVNLTIYEDGTILYDRSNSYNGDGRAILYRFKDDKSGLVEEKSAETQVGVTTAEDALGLVGQSQVDLNSLNWQTIENQTDLDIDAISKNDYSSIKGTWQNAQGEILVFDDLGIVASGKTLSTDVIIERGYLKTSIVEATSSQSIVFLPAGIKLEGLVYQDASDSGRARIWTGSSEETVSDASVFYYKID